MSASALTLLSQTGNFTFVIVTDRDQLDDQIYRNFLNTGTVTKAETAQPKSGEEMRKFLGQNKRLVFTLIQKFQWPKGKQYPLLSPRDDVIVIVDEAHRTQYRSLAENMRQGLPNAQYLAFTGTPLLGRERKTNKWFGGYVSEYNFQQSMDDGATVPLFYSKRVPQVLIQNEDLSDEFYEILEDENLDDAQQEKLDSEGHCLSLSASRLSGKRHRRVARQIHCGQDVRQSDPTLARTNKAACRTDQKDQQLQRKEKTAKNCRLDAFG
jgi:type I site-specific restriction-modification system R (restriction) subunit